MQFLEANPLSLSDVLFESTWRQDLRLQRWWARPQWCPHTCGYAATSSGFPNKRTDCSVGIELWVFRYLISEASFFSRRNQVCPVHEQFQLWICSCPGQECKKLLLQFNPAFSSTFLISYKTLLPTRVLPLPIRLQGKQVRKCWRSFWNDSSLRIKKKSSILRRWKMSHLLVQANSNRLIPARFQYWKRCLRL